jgi:sortase A
MVGAGSRGAWRSRGGVVTSLLVRDDLTMLEPPRSKQRLPKPPKPPRRMPKAVKVLAPMSPRRLAVRMATTLVAVVLLGMVAYLTGYSGLAHVIAQDRLNQELRAQLDAGTLPVSEGTFEDVLLVDGAPVAQLQIPQIGVDETVVEGTTAGDLEAGPGHRRDTMLPGQAGASVIMGRAAAFGGPFGRLQELQLGTTFTVVTGQGKQTFSVIGVRYAGDPSPAPLTAGKSRLILETARGPAFLPTGVVRVDADLVSPVQPPGARATLHAGLPPAALELAGDSSRLWALVFALQALVLVEVGAVWTYRRIGARQAWIVFVPLVLLAVLVTADQTVRLLPNLM